jgi:hypothetical protein
MSEKVLYMLLMGGLGNQMFQVAMALTLCKRFGYKLVLSDNDQSRYGTPRPIAWDSVLKPLVGFRGPIPEHIHGFLTEDALQENWDAIYAGRVTIADRVGFQGYFQSSKYYKDIKPELKQLFDYMDPERKAELLKKYIDTSKSRRVAVHFRFVEKWPSMEIWWERCAPVPFYKKVLDEIIKRDETTQILVFVDGQYDPKLIFDELGFNEKTVTFVDEKDYEEMWLIGQCHDVICPQSTFSWWSGYLSDVVERVFVPTQDYMGDDTSYFFKLEQPNWVYVEP